MTLREALHLGQKKLRSRGCPGSDPGWEAELLLSRACRLSREAILTAPDRTLTRDRIKRYLSFLRRRQKREPIAYIVGTAWCRGLEFRVSRNTLIPRPATESIIDAALSACSRHQNAAIFDIGTGCGCIAVSLAKAMPKARITATDVSHAALRRAKNNADLHHVGGRIAFRRGNLLRPVEKSGIAPKRAIVIVANLPYLPTERLAGLDPEIKDFEPLTALDGGPDGLDPYRRLIDQAAARFRRADLHLILEALPEQVGTLTAFAEKKLPGLRTEKITNLSGICVGAVMSSACTASPRRTADARGQGTAA